MPFRSLKLFESEFWAEKPTQCFLGSGAIGGELFGRVSGGLHQVRPVSFERLKAEGLKLDFQTVVDDSTLEVINVSLVFGLLFVLWQ